MVERYFKIASELMDISNMCADEEAANILKNGSLKIIQLAESHGGIIKRAEKESDSDAE
jgi:hypothetical protein